MEERMDNAPCGYIALSAEGTVREVNRTFLCMLGYEQNEVADRQIEAFLSPSSRTTFHSSFLPQLHTSGRVDEIYLDFLTRDGRAVPVVLSGQASGDATDCVALPVTKRLNSEAGLRRLLQTTLFSTGDGIIVTDQAGNITMMNPVAERFTGCPSREAESRAFEDVVSIREAGRKVPTASLVRKVLATRERLDYPRDTAIVSREGRSIRVSGSASGIFADDGTLTGIVVAFRDITREYEQDREIETVLNLNLDILLVTDLRGRFYKVNNRFMEVFGYSREEVVGREVLAFVHPEDHERTRVYLDEIARGVAAPSFVNRYLRKDGSFRYIEWHHQLGAGKYYYVSARDVTEKMQKEQALATMAQKDELTGLYNRHFLDNFIDEEMRRTDVLRLPLSMAILDIDRFKHLNDKWGHPAGDDFLRSLARLARESTRRSDLLVRIGGEEFLVLMLQTGIDGAVLAAEKIRAAVASYDHPVAGKKTVSIGVAERNRGESFDEWYRRADAALYAAKQAGRNKVFPAK